VNSLGDGLVGVHGLGGCDDDGLNANVGETGVDESTEESQEMASVSFNVVVVSEGTLKRKILASFHTIQIIKTYRVSPVSETDSLMVGCASSGDDDGDDYQTQETDNLDRGGDDFGFTKEANIQQVDC
jgi:hypothetical protein